MTAAEIASSPGRLLGFAALCPTGFGVLQKIFTARFLHAIAMRPLSMVAAISSFSLDDLRRFPDNRRQE
jgi:hypothetical protein